MANQTKANCELEWDHAVREIPERGVTRRREASPEELAQVAEALELTGCTVLTASYTIAPTLDGRYRLYGDLRAQVTQACVVTLEPVEGTIEENFDVTFWPPERMPATESRAIALDDEPEPEPILAGQIDVGRVVFECLAAAVDPFPRKPGATLDLHASSPPGSDAGKPENPFAVLANIKPKG